MTKCKRIKNLEIITEKGKPYTVLDCWLFADGALYGIEEVPPHWHFTTRLMYREIITDTSKTPSLWAGEHDEEKTIDIYSLKELNLDLYEITEDIDLALAY